MVIEVKLILCVGSRTLEKNNWCLNFASLDLHLAPHHQDLHLAQLQAPHLDQALVPNQDLLLGLLQHPHGDPHQDLILVAH